VRRPFSPEIHAAIAGPSIRHLRAIDTGGSGPAERVFVVKGNAGAGVGELGNQVGSGEDRQQAATSLLGGLSGSV
jgi:hypothetical protein